MTQSQRRRLPDVDAGRVGRQHAAQLIEQITLALLLEHQLEFLVGIEVILDGPLGGTGDEHQAPRARGERFLDRVLDQRLVDHRQHFLRARLGRRQKARAAAGHRKHGGTDGRPRARPHRNPPRAFLTAAASRGSGGGRLLGALGPLEDRRSHAVPGAAFWAAPVPADAVEPAIIALLTRMGDAGGRYQCDDCGLNSVGWYWRCPKCRSWDSMRPAVFKWAERTDQTAARS